MNDPNSLAALPFDQVKSSEFWQKASMEDRVSLTNKYFGDVASAMTGTKDDTEENRQALNTVRRAALYEVAPFLKQPEDIGTMENVSNAFTKSLKSFHENITLNLIQQNPEEAARYHREQERIYPTREGFGETLGRVTGMMLPTGAALLSAPVTGPLGLTGAASIAVGALYGASSAGAALGDIYAYEQATGDDVSSGKTAAVMAGHAVFEMATEMAGFGRMLNTARHIGQNLTESTAEAIGKGILNNERRQVARQSVDAMADFFTHNKKAAFALGWAKMGLIEGTEESASQIMQNVTDKLYRESGTLDGLLTTFKEGALGGLLLGPLAFGMQASAYTAQKDRMAMAGVNILDDALKVQARREAGAGANERVIADIYTSLRNEYDAENPIDRAALDNPTFMFLKEYFGMTGTETLPVRDSGAGKGKGALLTAADGTPIILIDTALLDKGFDGIFAFVAGHEFRHAMDKILGPEKSVTLAREIAGSVPEFAAYRATLDSARAAHQLGALSDKGTQDEVTADIFGQVYAKPQFLGAAIDAAVKNPAIGREVVRTLKDMRSRFERMGRRIDAQMEYTRTAWAEAKAADEARGDGQMTEQDKLEAAGVPILRLPRAAMEIAKAKIDGDVTALDRMTVQFVKSFETSLARQAEPVKAEVIGGQEPPEDLLGREAAPMSVVEGSQSMPPRPGEVTVRVTPAEAEFADWLVSGPMSEVANLSEGLERDASEADIPTFAEGVLTLPQQDVARDALYRVSEQLEDMLDNLRADGEPPAKVAAYRRAARSLASKISAQITEDSAPLSIKETPDEIFNRAFDKDATAFRASDEAKVLEDVWGSMKPTSYVLNEMFLKRRRYVLPERIAAKVRGQQTLSNAEKLLLRNFNELPDWVKLRNRDNPGSVKVMEWSPDAIDGMSLLGTGGLNATETATGFLRENGLDPSGGWQMQVAVGDVTVTDENRMRPAFDDGGTANADHVLEALHSNIKGYKTKGDFRKAVAAMMQTELKPHLDDLARRRVSKDIDARRITQRLKRMYDAVKPGTINRIVNEPTMNVTESLVSRDDLKIDDVIRQKDNLFVVDGFNPDRSPVVTPLRASAPFDTTPGAVDDPMADPELAKDYRFGMELPPVTPFYSVQAVFPLDMSVDAQDMAEEARAARPEEEVPFSVREMPDDVAYMKAVEAGDMVTAQRMVDEAATAAGYNTETVWHASDENFVAFDPKKSGWDGGFFFSTSEEEASQYGENIRPFYLRAGAETVVDWGEYDRNPNRVIRRGKKAGADIIRVDELDGPGADGLIVFNPANIKSAEPITRDDAGNVIPLSQRFNPQDNDIRRSIREVDSDLNFQRNYLRADTSFAPMEQAAKAILDANGAATHSEKLANLSKHKFIGREGDGTRAFAYDNLKKAGLEQLENKDKTTAAAYFGTADERVWLAKIREAEKQSVAHASMQGLTLGVYSFIAKRNAIANPFARGTFYMGMFRDIAGGMSKEDITNLDLWQNDILDSRKDAAEDVRGELLRMGREEFNRAMESHDRTTRKDWLRARFANKSASAPLSVKEDAGDLLDRVFGADFAQYYRRLKSAVGEAFQKELADAYGQENVALIVEQMEEHVRLHPGTVEAPATPKVKTPAAQAAEVLLAKAEEKYRKKLDQAIANDFKGELQAYYAQKISRALPVLSMDTAARAAALSPAERSAGIDKAFTALAKEAYEDLLKRKDGKTLAAAGFLTLEGVTKDLEGIKAILKEREVAFTALSSALAAAMRDANVTMADVLKASNETFGYVKTRLADDVKARVAEQLAKTVGMEGFPDALDEAAARAGRAVEQMLETRLADWIEDGNNVQMRDYNASRRAAKTLVDVLSGANAPEMTAKPYSATSKGLAATLLGDAAMFKNALAATLQAAQTKAESLGQDIITPMAQALGLPATATLADIEAAVLSTRLPPAVARRVVEEHLASTGRTVLGLLEPLAHLEPGRVADELAAEFGADTKPLWEAALTKLMSGRSAAIVKRLGKKRDAAPARRKDLLDTLLFAAATGQFDDASLMEHVSKAAGLPVLSEEARTQLRALVEDELKAIRETGDPESSFVKPFTEKIARLLAGEAVRAWRAEGKKAGLRKFSKIDRERLIAAFYASALSGPRTWGITNPLGSTLKTLATIMEVSAKNALLDRTLKKQGIRGVLGAWAQMFKAANIDGIKAAIKDDMSPGRIQRRFDWSGAMAASSVDNPDPETRLFGAGDGLWGKIERFTYGIAQKYVPRLIRAGDVGPFNMAADFGSYEAARKAALETNPDLTVEQADLEAKRILGFTSDGQIRPEFLAQAREEAARLFGGRVEEYKIRNRAREIATAQRPDYVQRLGDFIGGEGTFTSDAGIRYVETPGMDVSRKNNFMARVETFFSGLKRSENPAEALIGTALFPFTNIALKVFDSSLNYTLAPGLWRWKELQGLAAQDNIPPEMQKAYEEAADLALTRMVHGTLVTIAAMLLAAASRDDDPWIELAGAGPSDFKKNWQWREAGGRPFTITLPGGAQIDYRTSPFFSILAAAGSWADQKHLSEDERSGLVAAYGAGFFKSTLNQSFMSSASDLLGAITESDTEAGKQKLLSLFVNPLTTAIVPASGFLRQVEEQVFPYPNVGRMSNSTWETAMATMLSRIPMLNGFLPRKINALGRDVEGDRPTEVALGIQDWKRGSDEQAARVFDFSVAKRAWISVPNAIRTFVLPPDTALSKAEARRLADKDQALMTFAEYTAFMQRRGDIIVETFNKYEGELYKIEAGDKAAKVMDEIVSAAQDQAKRELLGLRPIKPGAVPADRKIRAAIRDAMAE